jgi:nucleotide-binding universal stress UspA family protein
MADLRAILVGIDESNGSMEALLLAGTWAKAKKTSVHAVHVIEVVRSLPLNAEMEFDARRGEQLLRKAHFLAQQHDFQLTGELLQSRQAGQALVDEAHQRSAHAIVLGTSYRRVYGDFQVGKTCAYALKHAKCPVWVVREGATE